MFLSSADGVGDTSLLGPLERANLSHCSGVIQRNYYFYYYLFKLQMGFYPVAVVLQ
jgi:hypothetical protein